MELVVNGEKKTVGPDISIVELLEVCNVEVPDMVSVQLNREFVDKSAYQDTLLSENDEVEFLYFLGGGAR